MTLYLAYGPPVILLFSGLVVMLVNKSGKSKRLTWVAGGLIIAATLYIAVVLVIFTILFWKG